MKKQLSSADDHKANTYAILVQKVSLCELWVLPGYKKAFKIIAKVRFYLFTSGVPHDKSLFAYTSTAVKLF